MKQLRHCVGHQRVKLHEITVAVTQDDTGATSKYAQPGGRQDLKAGQLAPRMGCAMVHGSCHGMWSLWSSPEWESGIYPLVMSK